MNLNSKRYDIPYSFVIIQISICNMTGKVLPSVEKS